MKNLKLQNFAWCVFALYACCFVVVAAERGKSFTDLWNILSVSWATIPLLLVIVGFFVSSAWRWPVFRGWLVVFPDLNGTWQGYMQTTWKNPETGEVLGPIPVILTIKQSFTKMSCVVLTAESSSRSCFADFWLDGDEQIRKLGYSYVNHPLPSVAHRSAAHEGSVILGIIGSPVSKLKGTYWTSRKTTGELLLTFRCRELLEEFPSDLGVHPVSGKES